MKINCLRAIFVLSLLAFVKAGGLGFTSRLGDCPGNDLWNIYKRQSNLADCASRCKSDERCVSFMLHDGYECYPKSQSCSSTDTSNSKNVFYDKASLNGYDITPGDCPGNDIWGLYLDQTDLATCKQRCDSSSECKAFMFYNGHRCYTKSATCAVKSITNPRNNFYEKASSYLFAGGRGFTSRPGDCPGNDLWNIYKRQSNLADCASRCKSDERCVSFMLHDGYECYPKSQSCSSTDTSNSKNVFYDKASLNGYDITPGDCPGNDIWGLYLDQTDLATCKQRCDSSSECKAFMFYNGHRCYTKSATCAVKSTTNPRHNFYEKVR